MILGLGAAYLIRLGFYPIAIVDGQMISAKIFEEAAGSARHYFNQVANTYLKKEDRDRIPAIREEIRRATLDKLIENTLVYKALTDSADIDVNAVVENRLNGLKTQKPDFEKAVSTLYGLTVSRFTELVLVPQAQQEILEERVKDEAADFSDWIKAVRKKSKVYVLARGLYWNGTEVLMK